MSNKPENETDALNSDEIKGEVYSTGERWTLFIVIYVVSLIICIVYLFLRTDPKQFSWPIFVLCLLYSSFFVTLNVMAMFDLLFSNQEGMEKFFQMVSIFYETFNWVDKICGYLIFNLMIAMMESGYSKILKKFLDYWIRIWKKIPKIKIEIIVRLIFAGGILTILIIFKKRFDLENNPFDYFSIILDVFATYDIHTNVGFFMFQIILDYKRKKDQIKINRYFIYSKIKIIENIYKYMKKVKDSYDELKKDAKIFEENDQPDYHKYLQKLYKEIKEKVIEYGYEVKDEENKDSINNNNINNNNINNNNNNDNDINNKILINHKIPENSNNMTGRVHLNRIVFQSNIEQLANSISENTNDIYYIVKRLYSFIYSKNMSDGGRVIRIHI